VQSSNLLEKSFELTLFPRGNWEGLKSATERAGYGISYYAELTGKRMPIVEAADTRRYVIVSAGIMGLKASARRADIYNLARRAGLHECRSQAGWELLLLADKVSELQIRDLLIGAVPIEVAPNFSLTFEVRFNDESGHRMDVDAGGAVVSFRRERRWLFEVA